MRLHSGDPSIYGATAEQMRRLNTFGIPFEVIPGVPAFAAAAAALNTELTLPNITQTIIVTRTAMKASGMSENESLTTLGQSKATLAIHLSIRNLSKIQAELIPHYGMECPVVVVYRATWPDQLIIRGTLHDIVHKVNNSNITRTAIIFIGYVFAENVNFRDSALYNIAHEHILRHRKNKTDQFK